MPPPEHDDTALPVDGRTRWIAGMRGFRVAFGVPGIVLFASSIGFGALARDLGLTIGQALTMSAAFFALPAQVVFIDEVARGADVLALALAVALTGIRLLPMAVTLVPFFREDKGPRWLWLVAIHTLAITPWLEAQRRLPSEPPGLRLPFYVGLGQAILFITLAGTFSGHQLAASLPTWIAASLVFATPIYFLLSLMGAAQGGAGFLAIGLGAALGPIAYLLVADVGLDLLVAGLLGGTIAWWFDRRSRRSKATDNGRAP